MKKSLMTLMLVSAMSLPAMATQGHIGDQSGKENTTTIETGDIGFVMGNICNQSGNNNTCNLEVGNIETVNGDVTNVNKVVDFESLTDEQKSSLKGETGATGATGEQGLQGLKGDDGVAGKDGVNGRDGKDGLNGKDGIDGISVTVADNGDGTVTVSGANGDVTITQGSQYDDTQVKSDIAQNKDKIGSVNQKVIGLTAEVSVAQDDIKDNRAAIETVNQYVDKVNDNVYLVAEHARVAHETALVVNDNLVAAVESQAVNNQHQQAQLDKLEEKKADKTQVANDIKNEAESTLTASKDYTNTEVSKVKEHADKVATNAKHAAIAHSDARDKEQDKRHSDFVVEQTKIDNRQWTSIEELYAQGNSQQTAITSNTNRIGALENRVDKLEVEIAGIHNDNRRQDGMIAGVLAASTFEMPRNWNGEWALQAAIGSYNNQKALALGVVHAGEGYAIRATVTGTNADSFSELGYGASITLSTSLFK